MPASRARSTTLRCSIAEPRTIKPAVPPQPKPISEMATPADVIDLYCIRSVSCIRNRRLRDRRIARASPCSATAGLDLRQRREDDRARLCRRPSDHRQLLEEQAKGAALSLGEAGWAGVSQ